MPTCRLFSLLARPSPHSRLQSLPNPSRFLSTLPNLTLFRALQHHDPSSLAIIHSASSRCFTYCNLVSDVLRAKEDLEHKAGQKDRGLTGERIAFLAENSYDYVGTVVSFFTVYFTRFYCILCYFFFVYQTDDTVMLFSILASNAIALPLSPAFPTGELQYILNNSQAKALLATEKYAEKATQVLQAGLERSPVFDVREKIRVGATSNQPVKLDDLKQPSSGGMMLYTSGTTNRPVGTTLII